jgi:hypothetical protein
MSDGYAYLWDVKQNERIAKFIEFGGFYVVDAYFSSDDRFVITESTFRGDSKLSEVTVKHWWDARTGEIIKAETAGIDNY